MGGKCTLLVLHMTGYPGLAGCRKGHQLAGLETEMKTEGFVPGAFFHVPRSALAATWASALSFQTLGRLCLPSQGIQPLFSWVGATPSPMSTPNSSLCSHPVQHDATLPICGL